MYKECKWVHQTIIRNFVFFYTVSHLSDDVDDLLNLINGSLSAAGWLIAMSVGIIIAEIIFTVIAIINIQSTTKLIFGIIVSSALAI